MGVSTVNNLISLQESQLIGMLHGQSARARSDASAENRRAWMAAGGQNLPGADGAKLPDPAPPETIGEDLMRPAPELLDPQFSPEHIASLVLALETQQASLESTNLLSGSAAGPGGRSLVDYLTSPEIISDAANDDAVSVASA